MAVLTKSFIIILAFLPSLSGCMYTTKYVLADIKQKTILYKWTHTLNYESDCERTRRSVLINNIYYTTHQKDLKCMTEQDYKYIYGGD